MGTEYEWRLYNLDGKTYRVPRHWSDNAAKILVTKYMRAAGIAKGRLDFVRERRTPSKLLEAWNYKCPPQRPDADEETAGENCAHQVFMRLACTWAIVGIEYGQITRGEAGSLADEWYADLYWQRAAPNSPQWFNTGLYHIYGIVHPSKGGYYITVDGKIAPVTDSYSHPQAGACFISKVEDNLDSIFEFSCREMRLFRYGSGSGANVSYIRSRDELLSGGGRSSGLMSFLKVHDVGAGTVKSGGKTRRAAKMVTLDVDHPDVEEFITWKTKEEKKVRALQEGSAVLRAAGVDIPQYDCNWEGEAYQTVSGQNSNNSIMVSEAFMQMAADPDPAKRQWALNKRTGGVAKYVDAADLLRLMAENAHQSGDPGLQFYDTMNAANPVLDLDDPSTIFRATNPCSEFVFVDDSACNLASINLCNIDLTPNMISAKSFAQVVQRWITVLDITVDMSQYPSEAIAINSRDYRPLGLGFANLGALVMRQGLAYDSPEARLLAKQISLQMQRCAFTQSQRLADRNGAYPKYCSLSQAAKVFSRQQELKLDSFNFRLPRNSQLTCIAPTGSIGFVMDCDTTGIEPDFALVKFKQVAGGGYMNIINASVEPALMSLGYSANDRVKILEYLMEQVDGTARNTLEGCPLLKPEHLPVFDCATAGGGTRSINWNGHLNMMAAVQPHISGAISKTVNLPHEATVEDVLAVFRQAHDLNLKAIAVYRDGSKNSQPLMTKQSNSAAQIPAPTAQTGGEVIRRSLPARRKGYTQKLNIGGQKFYLRTGEYKDGKLGEVFIDVAKQGDTSRSLYNALAVAVSIGLQYGIPLSVFSNAFVGSKFEPNGVVLGHENIKLAASPLDAIFRELELTYEANDEFTPADLDDEPEVVQPKQLDERELARRRGFEDATCPHCQSRTLVRNGSCMKCTTCGNTTGCS